MKNTKDEREPNLEKYKLIRERWDKEDTLLLSRTGIFLTTNSILIVTMRFQENGFPFQIGVAIVGLILSFLWLTTSLHSFKVISKLFSLCKNGAPSDLNEIHKIQPILFRPNTVFCKLIPGLMITGWVVFIIGSLASL